MFADGFDSCESVMLFCFSIDRVWKIPDASYSAVELQFPLNRKVKILLCVYA